MSTLYYTSPEHSEFQFSLSFSFISTYCHSALGWRIANDGWIYLPNVNTGIVWIPEQYRKNLIADETLVMISVDGYNRISFVNCVYGEDWHKCWSSK